MELPPSLDPFAESDSDGELDVEADVQLNDDAALVVTSDNCDDDPSVPAFAISKRNSVVKQPSTVGSDVMSSMSMFQAMPMSVRHLRGYVQHNAALLLEAQGEFERALQMLILSLQVLELFASCFVI
jgi:hypothetical protein